MSASTRTVAMFVFRRLFVFIDFSVCGRGWRDRNPAASSAACTIALFATMTMPDVSLSRRPTTERGVTASRALGYAQVLSALDGRITMDAAVAQTAQGTRRFVRRQRSWFRRDPRIHWLEPGSALLIRAGSVLTFQVHYTASGTATKDRSSIGFVFAKTPPADEIRVGQFINTRLRLPAGSANERVDAGVTVVEDVHLYGLLPHTHLRGTRWLYKLELPDSSSRVILDVPHYDFNWQTYYMFAKPLEIPAGGKITSTAWYDNSATNKHNPDPTAEVRWGAQTWEEMQYTGFMYSVVARKATP